MSDRVGVMEIGVLLQPVPVGFYPKTPKSVVEPFTANCKPRACLIYVITQGCGIVKKTRLRLNFFLRICENKKGVLYVHLVNILAVFEM